MNARGLILRRVLGLLPLLLAVSFLSFWLLSRAGGDAFSRLLADPQISQEQVAGLRALFGLDDPLPTRYLRWLSRLLQGDLGLSLRYQLPVSQLIRERTGNTLLLTGTSLVLIWVLGVGLGVLAALRPRGLLDRLLGLLAYLGLSTPPVLLALLLLLFAASTGLFPVGGLHDQLGWDGWGPGARLRDLVWHLVLPVAVLVLTGVGGLLRQVRGLMIEALGLPHVRNARLLGLPEGLVLRHAGRQLRNPLLTQLGGSLGGLLGGSFLVEIVFAWPGLASLTYEAVLQRDAPLLLASLLAAAVLLVLGNLLADLALLGLDPRTRHAG